MGGSGRECLPPWPLFGRSLAPFAPPLFLHRSGATDLRLCLLLTFGLSQNRAKRFVPYVGRSGSVNCSLATCGYHLSE